MKPEQNKFSFLVNALPNFLKKNDKGYAYVLVGNQQPT